MATQTLDFPRNVTKCCCRVVSRLGRCMWCRGRELCVGTVRLRDGFASVGSLDTTASPQKNWQGQSQSSCRAVGAGWSHLIVGRCRFSRHSNIIRWMTFTNVTVDQMSVQPTPQHHHKRIARVRRSSLAAPCGLGCDTENGVVEVSC